MSKRAAVWRGSASRRWWVDVCDAGRWRPGRDIWLRVDTPSPPRGFPTHAEAMNYAIRVTGQ